MPSEKERGISTKSDTGNKCVPVGLQPELGKRNLLTLANALALLVLDVPAGTIVSNQMCILCLRSKALQKKCPQPSLSLRFAGLLDQLSSVGEGQLAIVSQIIYK